MSWLWDVIPSSKPTKFSPHSLNRGHIAVSPGYNSFVLIRWNVSWNKILGKNTYNWYSIVVFPALSKPTIITLCSENVKKSKDEITISFWSNEGYEFIMSVSSTSSGSRRILSFSGIYEHTDKNTYTANNTLHEQSNIIHWTLNSRHE